MALTDFFTQIFKRQTSKKNDEHSTRVRLELALEASNLVDWDFDFLKNTAHRSLRHDQLYGYNEMLPKWNFDDFYHHVLPEYHDIAKKKFAEIPVTGEISFNYKIRRVDGEIRWISLTGRGQRNKKGKVIRVVGVLKDITSEKTDEEKLNLQLKNLTSLFENSPSFFCLLKGPKLIHEYVNPSHKKLLNGLDMTGLPIQDSQPGSEDTVCMTTVKNILTTGETLIYKDAATHIAGKLFYLDLVFAPSRNASNEVDGVYVLGTNVTDKILAIQQAEKSEAHMRLIADKLPAFVSYTDNEGRYQFMNKKYEEWFNRPLSEMIGKTREEIAPEDYFTHSQPFVDKAIAGSTSHLESVIQKPSGEILNLDINFVSDIDPSTKKPRGMIAVGVDITERVKAFREAELARKELHEIFMQAPTPMCLLSGPDLVFTMANPLYIQYLQRDVIGKTLKEVFENEDTSYYEYIISEVYKNGEAFNVTQVPYEMPLPNGKSSRHYLNIGFQPYKNQDNTTKGVLINFIEVTDQVNSVIARDNFISIASHELKTPITALKLQMQMNQRMLQDEGEITFDSDRLSKIFSTTISQVDRLARLVDDMLDGSRLTSEYLGMSYCDVNYSKLVTQTFETYGPQFKNLNMDLHLTIEENIILKLDENRMEQVLINLVTNALRYAPRAPVHVTLLKTKQHAVLKVKDHGIGIDNKFQEKIFERFERVDSGKDISGMGLGLYITRQIVDRHQGTITVSSELGKGSEFTVTIPLEPNPSRLQ